MCNLGFTFPCLFCLQNSNTRYLELRYPQLCSLGRKTARLNLYERSPDCRHYCLYSQRQSTAMVWESTTVKILSPGSFEPLLHANICTHALWRERGTSPWILICLCTREIQRSETGSVVKSRDLALPFCYLCVISPLEPTKAKGKLFIAFKSVTRLQKCQKQTLEIRNPNPSLVSNWNITVAPILNSDPGPSVPKFLENGDGLCLENGFSFLSEQQAQPSCNLEQMLHKPSILYLHFQPSQIRLKQVCWKTNFLQRTPRKPFVKHGPTKRL